MELKICMPVDKSYLSNIYHTVLVLLIIMPKKSGLLSKNLILIYLISYASKVDSNQPHSPSLPTHTWEDAEMRNRASVSLCIKWAWPCTSSNFLYLYVLSWHISLLTQTCPEHFMHQERQLHSAYNHTEHCHTGRQRMGGGLGEAAEGPSARPWVPDYCLCMGSWSLENS